MIFGHLEEVGRGH